MAESKTAEAQIVLGGDAHLDMDRKGSFVATHDVHGVPIADYEGKPTEEERLTLRRVAGKIPTIAYLICIVEFAERSSCKCSHLSSTIQRMKLILLLFRLRCSTFVLQLRQQKASKRR